MFAKIGLIWHFWFFLWNSINNHGNRPEYTRCKQASWLQGLGCQLPKSNNQPRCQFWWCLVFFKVHHTARPNLKSLFLVVQVWIEVTQLNNDLSAPSTEQSDSSSYWSSIVFPLAFVLQLKSDSIVQRKSWSAVLRTCEGRLNRVTVSLRRKTRCRAWLLACYNELLRADIFSLR